MRIFYNRAGGFRSVGYTPDGRVATLDNYARLAAWDIHSQRPQRIYTHDTDFEWAAMKGFRSDRGHVGVLMHYEYNRSSSIIEKHSVLRRFDLTTGSKLGEFTPGHGQIADVSLDGLRALVLEDDFRWRLWDIESNRPDPNWFELPGNSVTDYKATSQLAADSESFAVSIHSNLRLLVWKRGFTTPMELPRPGRGQNLHNRHYHFLAFSNDSRFLVGGQKAHRGRVTVWDLPEGTVRWSQPQDVYVWAIAVHPSGKIVAVATDNGYQRLVRFLDAGTGAEITRFNWNAGKIPCLAFSSDGLTCAAGCTDRRLVIWDVDV